MECGLIPAECQRIGLVAQVLAVERVQDHEVPWAAGTHSQERADLLLEFFGLGRGMASFTDSEMWWHSWPALG